MSATNVTKAFPNKFTKPCMGCDDTVPAFHGATFSIGKKPDGKEDWKTVCAGCRDVGIAEGTLVMSTPKNEVRRAPLTLAEMSAQLSKLDNAALDALRNAVTAEVSRRLAAMHAASASEHPMAAPAAPAPVKAAPVKPTKTDPKAALLAALNKARAENAKLKGQPAPAADDFSHLFQ